MITALRSDDRLIARMRESAAKPVTKSQMERQQISFVYGNLPSDSTITREQVMQRLKMNEGVE